MFASFESDPTSPSYKSADNGSRMSVEASDHPGDLLSDSSPSDSEESEAARPSRWHGPPSTWRSLTEQERGQVASLDALRDQNLSIHLYNASSLKRRAKEAALREELGISQATPLQEDTKSFVPSKAWTAWPMPPEDVPRTGEEIGVGSGDEKYTLKKGERIWPSSELEEILVGTTLKFAKETWMKRGEESVSCEEKEDTGTSSNSSDSDVEENIAQLKYRNSEAPKSVQQKQVYHSSNSGSDESQEDIQTGSIAMNPIEPAQIETLKPVISADDELSRVLLLPSVRHTLLKLDDILLALHHARDACLRHSRTYPNSDDEDCEGSIASGDPSIQGKRPRGRPRKFANQPSRSVTPGQPLERSPSPSALFRTKKTHRGRPQRNYKRLENETQYEYLVRIARIQKKSLPAFAPPLETSPSPSPSPAKRMRLSPIKRATEDELARSRSRRLGLRDWSEVLGAAALVGLDPAVIDRTSRRCAELFGECMTMRTVFERPYTEPLEALTVYHPEMISNLSDQSSSSSSDELNDSDHPPSKRKSKDSDGAQTPKYLSSNQAPKIQNHFCSIAECPRNFQGFRDQYSLRRHLQKAHGIAEENVEDYIIPSDEELDGAVHVDGFLRPLKPIQQLKKRKKKTTNARTAEIPAAKEAQKDEDIHLEQQQMRTRLQDADPEDSNNVASAESDSSSRCW